MSQDFDCDYTQQDYERDCLESRAWFDSLQEDVRWAHILDEYHVNLVAAINASNITRLLPPNEE